ncbi:MAG: hypothetical protein PVJ64_13220 [Gemmatimonadales bacterium]
MRKPTFPAFLALSAALAAAPLAACSDGLEPVPFQGVSGRVDYQSAPPAARTDWVRLAVYLELPQDQLDLLDFVTFSDTLPTAGDGSPYAVALEPGDYAFLVVVWKEAGNDNLLTALRAAGWHSAGGGPFEMPVPIAVTADSETADVDLAADFANMLTIQEVLDLLNP